MSDQERFAELKGSKVLRTHQEDDLTVILLADGRKFKLTAAELRQELATAAPSEDPIATSGDAEENRPASPKKARRSTTRKAKSK